jgi:type 1 glutamine amidotransferase
MNSIIYRYLLAIGLLVASCFNAHSDNLKALIITGQNNHNWKVSHVALKKILENSGLFTVDVALSPEKGENMSNFTPDFKSYQVVILDYNGDSWSKNTNKQFLDYVKNGGGVVIYHAANNAFTNWKEYNEITALGGWGNRTEAAGPYVYWDNNKLVRNNEPGAGGAHGPAHEFVLNAREKNNPVMTGLPEKWKHASDELYGKLRGPGNIKETLFTAFSDTEKGGSGREEPLIFTVNFGKARIFHTTLGHAGPTLEDNPSMQCTGFQVTLLRGCEWAATGKVTQPVPDDFPTANEIRLRPTYKYYPQPMGMRPEMSEYWQPQPTIITPGIGTANAYRTAPADAIVLFDGKDLSKWQKPGGEAAGWKVHDGIVTIDKSTGDIQTKDEFKDFQLHVEWLIPVAISGTSQSRGNSGVYLQNLYEIQILDTYNNETYSNGAAGSIYKQSPPLVNPIRKPGEWNEYDIIFTAPTFTKDGQYRTPPTVTVLFNGVLVQNHTIIKGTTEYIGFPTIVNREKGPILLQSHGDPSEPISFRNIWLREL